MTNRTVYRGKIIRLEVDRVRLPNGASFELEVVRHPGGSAVVALDDEGRVCLLRQYRHVAGGWLWELPAGKREHGEPPEATAVRELREEAGIVAADWRPLGRIFSSPGVFDEQVHLFFARGLDRVPIQTEKDELIEVHWVPLDEAVDRAAAGDILDGKSVAGLFRAAALVGAGEPISAGDCGRRTNAPSGRSRGNKGR